MHRDGVDVIYREILIEADRVQNIHLLLDQRPYIIVRGVFCHQVLDYDGIVLPDSVHSVFRLAQDLETVSRINTVTNFVPNLLGFFRYDKY